MLELSEKNIDPAVFYQNLYESILNDDIQSLLSMIYSIWGLPASIIDMNYALVGMQPFRPIGDPTYDAIVKMGGISQQMVQQFLDGMYMAEIMSHDEPYVVDWGITEQNHRLSYRLLDSNTFYGAISVVLLNHYQWTQADSQILKAIVSACTQIMAKRQLALQSQLSIENWLLASLIRTGHLEPKAMKTLQKKLGCTREYKFQLLRLHSGPMASPYHLEYLKRRFQVSFPTLFCCQLQDKLYVLLHHTRKEGLKNLLNQVQAFMRSESEPLLGASRVFGDLNEIAVFRLQADFMFTYALQKGLTGVQLYEEHVLEHVSAVLKEHLPHKCLDSQALTRLARYDRENGTEYIQTLQVFLYYFLDSKKTIEHFQIHRNTLLHRLTRIQQVSGLDFHNPRQVMELMLAFLLQENGLQGPLQNE